MDDFDYYSASFSFLDEDEGLFVNWKVHGKEEELMSFLLPNLAGIILGASTSFSSSAMEHQKTRLYKFEGIDTYEEYIHTRIVPESEVNERVESIEYIGRE